MQISAKTFPSNFLDLNHLIKKIKTLVVLEKFNEILVAEGVHLILTKASNLILLCCVLPSHKKVQYSTVTLPPNTTSYSTAPVPKAHKSRSITFLIPHLRMDQKQRIQPQIDARGPWDSFLFSIHNPSRRRLRRNLWLLYTHVDYKTTFIHSGDEIVQNLQMTQKIANDDLF